ncbi:HNH endonuclease [Acidipila sp. EB88]|nr:HNH endonuclease [Acidipila sp. EB88]
MVAYFGRLVDRRDHPIRVCFRPPVPEIALAAGYLDRAVSMHLKGEQQEAEALIALADKPEIRQWTESIWGKDSPYVQRKAVCGTPEVRPLVQRHVRMPTSAEILAIHQRDGFNCRFCGIPVIRKEIRQKLAQDYPKALPWGRTNILQHAAFQAMWAQYDHVLPHARGGDTSLDNLLLTCAPCNFGRMNSTLDEVGIQDPRLRAIRPSTWDGLERLCRLQVGNIHV